MDQSDQEACGLSDAEINTFNARAKVLQRYGLSEDEAYQLAERLLARDRDPSDNRRICLACAHLRGEYCQERRASKVKGFTPCKTVLWRCDYFQQKG